MTPPQRTSLAEHRLVRAGVFAWAIAGLCVVLWIALVALDTVRLAVVPLVLALFPAAPLTPVAERLRRWGRLPPAAVAAVVVVTFLVTLVAGISTIGWLIGNEIPAVLASLDEAYQNLDEFVSERFDITFPAIEDAIEQAQEWAAGQDLQAAGISVAATTAEILSSILLILVALFFYVKDGERITRFLVQLAPARHRDDVAEVGRRVWGSVGGYFRGQIIVAAVDAVLIGLGLVLLGVPLAVPLAALVFLGGMFPIVGAFAAGALAVLVALADAGLPTALAVLLLNVGVQQAEGNLLEPLIVGRATRLHPLLILAALTAGGVTLGILGAFLAVPVTASVVRAVGYAIEKDRGATPSADEDPPPEGRAGAGGAPVEPQAS